ncbi:MAG: hypothetical protein JRI90_17145, partial [Deltaproteobacteria bacterium]|nr:hypothetical protein [Deltaproteobacteria bacterium]
LESRASVLFAATCDVAPVALNNAIDHSKAKAGSFARLLCGEKGVENVLHGLTVHSFTCISYT